MSQTDTPAALDPRSDPAAAAKANQLLEEIEKDKPEVVPPALPDTTVTLPGGFLSPEGTLYPEVEIRELNGSDEEAIAKLGNASVFRQFSEMLRRCVVQVGGKKPKFTEVDSLLIGDQEALLLDLRRVTYGDEVEMREVYCPECGRNFDVAVELSQDVPIKEMEEPDKRVYNIPLRPGLDGKNREAEVRLVTAADRLEAFSPTRTQAEINSALLQRIITKLDGNSVISKDTVLKMGAKDRKTIIEFVQEKQPGPQWDDVKVPCSNCGEEVSLALNLAWIFQSI